MAIRVYPSKKTVRPSVNIQTNSDNLVGTTSNTNKQLMLIGMARGGEPNKVYEINTFADAKSIFRGGDLLDAIEVALTPNNTVSSGTIYAERVGKATQATFTNNGLTLTSKTYSVDANNIQTSLIKNTLNDTYNLSISFDVDGYYKTYTNLGKVLGIYYTGKQQYADYSIEVDAPVAGDTSQHTGLAQKLILRVGADAGSAKVVREFQLGSGKYAKASEVINSINDIDGFNAVYFYYGNKNIETKYLDAADKTQISTASTTPTYLTSLGGDIVNTLGLEDDTAVVATYDPSKGEPKEYELTTLTGGSSNEIAPATWAKEIQNFATVRGTYIVPLTDDSTIQAEAVAFCSDRIKEADPRAVLVGGGFNDSANATIQRANLLRSRDVRVGVNACSGYRYMNNGTVQHLPAYVIAAQIGGLITGMPVGESITFKTLDLVDIDQKFTKDQLDLLDSNGAFGIEYVRNRNGQEFRVTNDITTARTISTDPVEIELATGEEVDFLVTDLRSQLETAFIGNGTNLSIAGDIKAFIISFLQQQQNSGVIVDYSEADIHVAVIGETVNINIACVLSRTIKTINVGFSFVNEQLNA